MAREVTILHAGPVDDVPRAGFRTDALNATVDSTGVFVRPEDVGETLGWKLRDEGLCRGDVCIPVRDRSALVKDIDGELGIDLAELATILDRPLALDVEEGCAALGTAAGIRAHRMESLEAPDFELPDLLGRTHRLSDHRGKKVLLIAHASW